MSDIVLTELAVTPVDLPGAGQKKVYFKAATGHLYMVDALAVETQITGVGGGGYTQFICGLDAGDPYATVQTAIDAAHTEFGATGRDQMVHVKPGTYVENLVFKAGVSIGSARNTAMIDSLAMALNAGMPVVVGEHTVQAYAGLQVVVEGLVFQRSALVSPVLDILGTLGSTVVFNDCLFIDPPGGPGAGDFISVNGDSNGDFLALVNCTITVNTTGPLLHVDGDVVTVLGMRIPQVIDLTAAGSGGYVIENSGGDPDPAIAIFEDVGSECAIDVRDDTEVFASSVEFRNDTGALCAQVASLATLEASDVVFHGTGGGERVTGSGTLRMHDCAINGPIDTALNVELETPKNTVMQTAITTSISVAAPPTIDLMTGQVDVDTAAISAVSTIRLPDPTNFDGPFVVVRDVSGAAPQYPITITCAGPPIIGTSLLDVAYGSIVYQANSGQWRQLAPVVEGMSQYVVGKNGYERYSVVQPAIDEASAHFVTSGEHQVVWVLPGTYVEDLTFKPGVHVRGAVNGRGVLNASAATTGRAVVQGELTFDVAAGAIQISVEDLVFEQAVGANVLLDHSGVGSGDQVVFTRCHFLQVIPGPATARIFDLQSSTNAAADLLEFNNCIIMANYVGNCVNINGDDLTVNCIHCRMINIQGGQHGFLVTDTFGGKAATLELHDSHESFRVETTNHNVLARLFRTRIYNGSGTSAAIILGAAANVEVYDVELFTNGHTYAVEGTGQLRVGGSMALEAGVALDPAATYVYQTFASRANESGEIWDAPVGPGAHIVPLPTTLVNADTSGVAPTITLPNAALCPGKTVYVYDATPGATAKNVTVNAAAGSTVIGTATLATDSQRIGYLSNGADWIQVSDEI